MRYADTGLEVILNKTMFDAMNISYDGKTFVVPMTREFAADDDKDEYMLTFSPDGMDDAMLVEFCCSEAFRGDSTLPPVSARSHRRFLQLTQ